MKKSLLSFSAAVFALLAPAVYGSSPYITKVYDYLPGMGQFVNVYPKYQTGDTKADMIQKVEDQIAHNNQGLISLGGWGGYVIFGFDHMVENIKGEYDFIVLGNAFEGNAEPGIVMVSYDKNGNGEPDDEWFELAGSEYGNKSTWFNVDSTYRRDADTIKNPYHKQPYYPQWLEEDEYTLHGTILPKNATYTTMWVLRSFAYGYADNYPNTDERAKLKIDWAVNSAGQPVTLPGIHFVKVYNGMDQTCGDLGETSTEITGATDLHLRTAVESLRDNEITGYRDSATKRLINNQLIIYHLDQTYNILGQPIH